jgi:hypothetical protein
MALPCSFIFLLVMLLSFGLAYSFRFEVCTYLKLLPFTLLPSSVGDSLFVYVKLCGDILYHLPYVRLVSLVLATTVRDAALGAVYNS